MTEKYFNRYQAEELLPFIGDFLEQARKQKNKVEVLDGDLARAATRVSLLGGSLPDYKELVKKKADRERFAAKMLETVNKIQETGCVVKDLDEGLVDFPSLLQGKEVFLCWKLGEERIEFYHGIDEGFAGRKPLDDTTPDGPPRGAHRRQ